MTTTGTRPAAASAAPTATRVWVLSWVVFDASGEQTSGGFDWFADPTDAREAFTADCAHWRAGFAAAGPAFAGGVRVRLVHLDVPADTTDVTRWIDDNLDLIEYGPASLPADAVSLITSSAALAPAAA